MITMEYLLQDITKIVLTKMNSIFEENSDLFDKVTKVLIELQPKINNKMKLISHLIYGKFVELFINNQSCINCTRIVANSIIILPLSNLELEELRMILLKKSEMEK